MPKMLKSILKRFQNEIDYSLKLVLVVEEVSRSYKPPKSKKLSQKEVRLIAELAFLKIFVAYEQFTAIIGDHAACKAQNGEIRRVGGFEATGTAPINGYNCTSYLTIISKVRAEALNIKALPESKWSKVSADRGFGGRTTTKKVSTLPKKTEKRLPSGYKKLL